MSTVLERRCENCGAAFSLPPWKANKPGRGRFCSKRCRAKWQFRNGTSHITCGVYGPAHPAYRNGSRMKHAPRRGVPEANIILNNAIASGQVTRQPCSRCGSPDAEGHHEDYERPLDVVWYCRPCHRERDAALRAELGVQRLSPIPAPRHAQGAKRASVVDAIRALRTGGGDQRSLSLCHPILSSRGISVGVTTIRRALRAIDAA